MSTNEQRNIPIALPTIIMEITTLKPLFPALVPPVLTSVDTANASQMAVFTQNNARIVLGNVPPPNIPDTPTGQDNRAQDV